MSPSREEALEILRLHPNPSRNEIEKQFRLLATNSHPDHGGDAGDFARILTARDRLLEETSQEVCRPNGECSLSQKTEFRNRCTRARAGSPAPASRKECTGGEVCLSGLSLVALPASPERLTFGMARRRSRSRDAGIERHDLPRSRVYRRPLVSPDRRYLAFLSVCCAVAGFVISVRSHVWSNRLKTQRKRCQRGQPSWISSTRSLSILRRRMTRAGPRVNSRMQFGTGAPRTQAMSFGNVAEKVWQGS